MNNEVNLQNNSEKKSSVSLFAEISCLKEKIDLLEKKLDLLFLENSQNLEKNFNYIDKSFYRLNSVISRNLSISDLHHASFSKFRACHINSDMVVVGSGPSLNYFDNSIHFNKPIYIALNSAFQYNAINFDYLFIQDYSGLKEIMSLANNYRKGYCTKFYGILPEHFKNQPPLCLIPEQEAFEANALRYRTDYVCTHLHQPQFAYDLLNSPLGDFHTVSLSALQFALWTMPKKIYLVGLDCTNSGHFNNCNKNYLPTNEIINSFFKFKEFVKDYYPSIEIISINPIGLKGLFKDKYSKAFKNR